MGSNSGFKGLRAIRNCMHYPTYSPYISPTQGIYVYRMILTAKTYCFTNINRLVFVDKPEFVLSVTNGIFTYYLHEFQYSWPSHGSGGLSPASQGEGSYSIPDQSM